MGSLKEFGHRSYLKAHWNDFIGALECLNDAIRRYPKEEKLYNNRSFVLFSLGRYNEALEDADFMVQDFPLYSKSHYRKGEVCMALARYKEAIAAFEMVLELNPDCKEASIYRKEAMLSHLCSTGKYFRISAIKALSLTNDDLNQAEQFLAIGGLCNVEEDEEVYYSDEDIVAGPSFNIQNREKPSSSNCNIEPYDPLTDPENPFNSASIWVGNVTEGVTDAVLKSVFKKYGNIINCYIQQKHFCAFVNYGAPSMASNAMRKFPQEGLSVGDTTLVIRFPDNASKNKAVLKPNSVVPKKKKN